MSKKLLKVEYNYDFILLGMVSTARDYRLCWHINRETFINLEKADDLRIETEQGESFHSRYTFTIEHTETDFILLANKGTQSFLVPEMKQIDYFLIIHNLINHKDQDVLTAEISRIPLVQAVFVLDPADLRSKENLLF